MERGKWEEMTYDEQGAWLNMRRKTATVEWGYQWYGEDTNRLIDQLIVVCEYTPGDYKSWETGWSITQYGHMKQLDFQQMDTWGQAPDAIGYAAVSVRVVEVSGGPHAEIRVLEVERYRTETDGSEIVPPSLPDGHGLEMLIHRWVKAEYGPDDPEPNEDSADAVVVAA